MLDTKAIQGTAMQPTPLQIEAHRAHLARRGRLFCGNAPAPAPKPQRYRPLSPIVHADRKQKEAAMAELAKAFPLARQLFTAAIVEVDADGNALTEEAPLLSRMPAWRRIGIEVAQKHGFKLIDLQSPRRETALVRARHEAFWRCLTETTMSYPQIGRHFGGRDHTTVLHGYRQHQKRMLEAQNG